MMAYHSHLWAMDIVVKTVQWKPETRVFFANIIQSKCYIATNSEFFWTTKLISTSANLSSYFPGYPPPKKSTTATGDDADDETLCYCSSSTTHANKFHQKSLVLQIFFAMGWSGINGPRSFQRNWAWVCKIFLNDFQNSDNKMHLCNIFGQFIG